MELTNEQLEQLEEMAAALLPPADIAILLGIPSSSHDFFIQLCKSHKYSPIYERYQRGKLTTKLELRKTIIKLAKAGSPAAEPLAQKFISEQNIDE